MTPDDNFNKYCEAFILFYKDRGKPLPAGIAQSVTGQGKISIAV